MYVTLNIKTKRKKERERESRCIAMISYISLTIKFPNDEIEPEKINWNVINVINSYEFAMNRISVTEVGHTAIRKRSLHIPEGTV